MLCKVLRSEGHTCDEAEDGLIAVEKVKQKMAENEGKRVFDAILMDFVMPHMDGPTGVCVFFYLVFFYYLLNAII